MFLSLQLFSGLVPDSLFGGRAAVVCGQSSCRAVPVGSQGRRFEPNRECVGRGCTNNEGKLAAADEQRRTLDVRGGHLAGGRRGTGRVEIFN